MLTTALLVLSLAVAGLAQAPAGYRTVYITSAQDTKFAVVPKSRTASATLVVYVFSPLLHPERYNNDNKNFLFRSPTCLPAQPIPHLLPRTNMVHGRALQPHRDPALLDDAVHGRGPQGLVERHGADCTP